MGLTVESVTADGVFTISGRDAPIVLRQKPAAEIIMELGIPEYMYLEPKVTMDNTVQGNTIAGILPSWALFTKTTAEELSAALTRKRETMGPVRTLKSVGAIEAAQRSGCRFDNIILLNSGSMHAACHCCNPDMATVFITEALEFSIYFGRAPWIPLLCMVQDPGYSSMEKRFLESKAIKVLDDPDAFAMIDTETLLIAYNVKPHIIHTVSRGTYPAAILTTLADVSPFFRPNNSDAPPWSALEVRFAGEVKAMLAMYTRIGFHDVSLEEARRVEVAANNRRNEKELAEKFRKLKLTAPCLLVRTKYPAHLGQWEARMGGLYSPRV